MFRILRMLVLLLALMAVYAPAQQPPSGRIYVVTYIDVFPNFAMDTSKLMHEFAEATRKEPGAVRFEVLRDVFRANHFSLVEVWESQQAYDAHLKTANTRQFREKIQPWLGGPFDARTYNLQN